MITTTNHKAVPFFERIPPRALPVVHRACTFIETQRPEVVHAHKTMCADLAAIDIAPPALDEFRTWFEEVRLGRHMPDDYRDTRQRAPCIKAIEKSLQRWGVPSTIQIDADSAFRLENARGIVRAAHGLFEAKSKAGHNPLSFSADDTVVSEAIRELLELEVEKSINGVIYTAPVDVALAYLAGGGADQDGKLLDILTMDMQQELCRELVRTGAATERARNDYENRSGKNSDDSHGERQHPPPSGGRA